jgi:hypothetical protein
LQQKGFFARIPPQTHHLAFALQNEQNHGLQLFCSDSHSRQLLQKLAMPLQPHNPCIVLLVFARSWSAAKTSGFNYIMGKNEASSSSCIAALLVRKGGSNKNGCQSEPVEAWWAGPLRASLRQAQTDRPGPWT